MKKWTCLVLMLLSQPVAAAMVTCKAIGPSDRDTFTCLDLSQQQYKVRLSNIDSSERTQHHKTRAHQNPSQLNFSKSVVTDIQDVTKYGQSIRIVFLSGTNIGRAMVARNAVWVHRQHDRDRMLLSLETGSKASITGLWPRPEFQAIPSWEWRRNVRHSNADPSQSLNSQLAVNVPNAVHACGMWTCEQMTSCTEPAFT